LIYAKNNKSIDDARSGIFSYIELFHNRKRRHSANDKVSPITFDEHAAKAAYDGWLLFMGNTSVGVKYQWK